MSVCHVTGKLPDYPVISPQGYIFEREAILKHIKTSGRCPVTGEDLSEFALYPIHKGPEFVSPSTGTGSRSIPAMIKLFRIEVRVTL